MLSRIRKLWYSLHRTETVYKVVKQGRYKSVIAMGRAQIEYEIGEWITAPDWLARRGYHPLCFKSLEEAHAVIQEFGWCNIAIWRISIRDAVSYDALPPMCNGHYLQEGAIKPTKEWWPEGTIMAKAVRLEEKVWDSKEDE